MIHEVDDRNGGQVLTTAQELAIFWISANLVSALVEILRTAEAVARSTVKSTTFLAFSTISLTSSGEGGVITARPE